MENFPLVKAVAIHWHSMYLFIFSPFLIFGGFHPAFRRFKPGRNATGRGG